MDFDFTDDNGDGIEVEANPNYGILLAASANHEYAGEWLTPEKARKIADALNACADHMEDK